MVSLNTRPPPEVPNLAQGVSPIPAVSKNGQHRIKVVSREAFKVVRLFIVTFFVPYSHPEKGNKKLSSQKKPIVIIPSLPELIFKGYEAFNAKKVIEKVSVISETKKVNDGSPQDVKKGPTPGGKKSGWRKTQKPPHNNAEKQIIPAVGKNAGKAKGVPLHLLGHSSEGSVEFENLLKSEPKNQIETDIQQLKTLVEATAEQMEAFAIKIAGLPLAKKETIIKKCVEIFTDKSKKFADLLLKLSEVHPLADRKLVSEIVALFLPTCTGNEYVENELKNQTQLVEPLSRLAQLPQDRISFVIAFCRSLPANDVAPFVQLFANLLDALDEKAKAIVFEKLEETLKFEKSEFGFYYIVSFSLVAKEKKKAFINGLFALYIDSLRFDPNATPKSVYDAIKKHKELLFQYSEPFFSKGIRIVESSDKIDDHEKHHPALASPSPSSSPVLYLQ